MDPKLLLAKSLTLLYRENQLPDKTENSADLVRTVLDNIQVSDISIGINTDREVIMALKATILEMCNQPHDHVYSKTDLLQRVRINTGSDDKLYDAIKQGLEDDMVDGALKRSIINLRKTINNHFKEQQIGDILNQASSTFKFKRESIRDINKFLGDILAQLEPLQISNVGKDPAMIDEIDIGNDETLKDVFNKMVSINSGTNLFKTGWPEINDMIQGGFRPGETWIFGGLQHKYKTGFSLSIFADIAMFNTPVLKDPTKKPLLLRISFEDPMVNNLQFLYQYIKFSETRETVRVADLSIDEMSGYVKSKMQATGFHIKMLRVDPTQWTYKSICNKVIEYEAQGYEVQVLGLDYLYKIPTTGCTVGPAGNDVMDLLSRVRSFCSSKGIFMFSPHQLSTEAKQLLRGGMPEDQFVKEIATKGYFEGSRGLDRIYDGCILFHLFKHNRETYFAIQLDKHRLPTIVEDEFKFFIKKFPKGMPIPHSIDGQYESYKKLPSVASNTSEDLFKLG